MDRVKARGVAAGVTAAVLAASLVTATSPFAVAAPDGPDDAGLRAFSDALPAASVAVLPTEAELRAGLRSGLRSDGVTLPSSGTSQEPSGSHAAARSPRLLKREAWLTPRSSGSVPAEQDVTQVDLVQDVVGAKVTITAPYRAVPTAARNSVLAVTFGAWNADESSCVAKVRVLGYAHSASASDAAALDLANNAVGTVTRSLSGSTLGLTWTGGRAGDQGFSCVYADTIEALAEGVGPVLETSLAKTFTAIREKSPTFSVDSSALHAAQPKKWTKIRVTVRNTGDGPATRAVLRASGAKLKLKKKSLSLGTLAPGARKSVELKVKLTGKATRTLKLTVSSQGGWTSTSRTGVGHRAAPKRLKSLVGRSYWASPVTPGVGWDVQQITFVNRTWAYRGVPKSGTPASCSKGKKGCVKYTYNARRKTVRMGSVRAEVDSHGLTTKGKKGLHHTPLQRPRAGLRTNVSLSHHDFKGCQGAFALSCSSWTRHLTLRPNGTFAWTYSAIHSSGIPPHQTFVAVSRPTKTGTYAFLSRGRLRLTYVDAESGKRTTETYTAGIDQDVLGRHAPRNGLLLGGMPHLP